MVFNMQNNDRNKVLIPSKIQEENFKSQNFTGKTFSLTGNIAE